MMFMLFTFHSLPLPSPLLHSPLPLSFSSPLLPPPPLPSSLLLHLPLYSKLVWQATVWKLSWRSAGHSWHKIASWHSWHKIARDVLCFSYCIHKLILTFSHFVYFHNSHAFSACQQHFTSDVYLFVFHCSITNYLLLGQFKLPSGQTEWRRQMIIRLLDW